MKKLTGSAVALFALVVTVHRGALHLGVDPRYAILGVIFTAAYVAVVSFADAAFKAVRLPLGIVAIVVAAAAFTATLTTFGIVAALTLATFAAAFTEKLLVSYWRAMAVLVVEGLAVYVCLTHLWWWVFPGAAVLFLLYWFSSKTSNHELQVS
jgi:hypothetical protein